MICTCSALQLDRVGCDCAASHAPAAAKPTMADMIAAVRAHAEANYNREGWDYLVECWDDAEIAEQIGAARTIKGAIASCRCTVKLMDEQRREARAAGGEF